MVGEGRLEPGARCQVVRILGAPAQLGLDLLADPLDRLRIEPGLAQRQAQQLERALALRGQRLELAGELVAAGLERQADRPVFELGAKRLAVQVAGTLVEQARGHVGEPLLARRIERRATSEVQGERQERDRGLADQVGLDPARADHALDLARSAAGRRHAEQTDGHHRCQQQRTSPRISHQSPAPRRFRPRRSSAAGGAAGIGAGPATCCGAGTRRPVTEVSGRNTCAAARIDLGGGDRTDPLGPRLHVGDGAPGGKRHAEAAHRGAQAVLGVGRLGDQTARGALDFLVRDRLLLQALELGPDRRLQLIERDPRSRRGVDAERGQVERAAAIEGAGRGRELLVDHQRAVETRGAGAAEDLGEHLERVGVLGRAGGEARRQVRADPRRLLHARIAEHDVAHCVLGRLLDPDARRDRTRRYRPIVFLGERPQLRGVDVAGNDQHRIVGRVPGVVEGERVLAGVARDLVPPADHRNAVRMMVVLGRVELLAQARARIVVDPLRALLEHDAALVQHFLLAELQVGHAVGLHLHDQLEAIPGDGLEVAGVIGAGERVLVAAIARDDARELAGRQTRRCP